MAFKKKKKIDEGIKENNQSPEIEDNENPKVKDTDTVGGMRGKDSKDILPPPPEGQMYIKVYSPFKTYFDSLGTSITAENDTGVFDILPGHHKFLTLLSACEIKIQAAIDTESESVKIDRAIMFVKEDRVTVFLDV